MPKEDRSDWVAVAPESSASTATDIPKAKTAFQYFQKERADQLKQQVRQQNDGQFAVAALAKHTHHVWNNELSDTDKAYFEDLARQDAVRYAAASHAADVAALERKERLRAERETLMLDDEGGPTRTTRNQYEKKQRKKERRQKKKRTNKGSDDERSDYNQDDEDEGDDWDSDVLDSDDSEEKKKKSTPKKPRQVSQKQLEYQARKNEEKEKKVAYIAERQSDLRKEKADQAKRRLEFLLKQSDIFSHFGRVKEDQAKYGIVTAPPAAQGSRRDAGEAADDEDLTEADEHEATFLTAQPSTLSFGKMRDYQLEGLNWMIRLQENGVNGILADEVSVIIVEVRRRFCEFGIFVDSKSVCVLLLICFS